MGKAKDRLRRLETEVKQVRMPCDRLKAYIKDRTRAVKEYRKYLAKAVSHTFNYYLSHRGHTGRVNVEYETGTLCLAIQMNGCNQLVQDTRSLSGGERSFSTLCF